MKNFCLILFFVLLITFVVKAQDIRYAAGDLIIDPDGVGICYPLAVDTIAGETFFADKMDLNFRAEIYHVYEGTSISAVPEQLSMFIKAEISPYDTNVVSPGKYVIKINSIESGMRTNGETLTRKDDKFFFDKPSIGIIIKFQIIYEDFAEGSFKLVLGVPVEYENETQIIENSVLFNIRHSVVTKSDEINFNDYKIYGSLYSGAPDYELIENLLTKNIGLDKNDGSSLATLAYIHMMKGEFESALKLYQDVLKILESNPASLTRVGPPMSKGIMEELGLKDLIGEYKSEINKIQWGNHPFIKYYNDELKKENPSHPYLRWLKKMNRQVPPDIKKQEEPTPIKQPQTVPTVSPEQSGKNESPVKPSGHSVENSNKIAVVSGIGIVLGLILLVWLLRQRQKRR